MNEIIYLKVSSPLILLLIKNDPTKWKRHIQKENGYLVIFVSCSKPIYRTLNEVILVYKKLTKYFTNLGFKMNLYEPCAWNKEVN